MLERREMLIASINDFGLLNDTGLSDTDLSTEDPRVTGVVGGDFTSGHVEIEFDHYADGSTDGYAWAFSPGESFTYDPTMYDGALHGYSGPFTVNYRGVQYDDLDNVVSTTDWQSFTYMIMFSQVTIDDVTVTEGQTAMFSVTLSPAPIGTVSVEYYTADDGGATASEGDDFQDTSGTLTFASGETWKTISVATFSDQVSEPDETFWVKVSASSGWGDNVDMGLGTILDGPSNNPPVAYDDSYSVFENETLSVSAPGVLGNDSDPDGDPLVADVDTWPMYGTLDFISDGSFSYTPNPNYVGTESFTYFAVDDDATSPHGHATVTIEVIEASGPNNAPVLDPIGDRTVSQLFELNFTASATGP